MVECEFNRYKTVSFHHREHFFLFIKTRTVRGSDYSPAIELSEQKDKLVTATGDTEKYSENVWLNSVNCFQDMERKRNSDIKKGP